LRSYVDQLAVVTTIVMYMVHKLSYHIETFWLVSYPAKCT